MRKIAMLAIVLICAAPLLYAQNNDDSQGGGNLGPGLTRKKVANFEVVTAEDAEISTDGKLTRIEDSFAYTARKFKAVEARLTKIEAIQKELADRVKDLEKNLNKTQ